MRVHLANSRIALIAQSALDLAGQYIFAVDQAGNTRWPTPQVNQLLEAANNNHTWLSEEPPQEIQAWFEHKPAMGMSQTLNAPSPNLKIFFLGKASGYEYLLILLSHSSENESEILK
ncbi:MAG: hypothetical protein ACJAUP_000116 [Cellvibrionaceae bacterium]|jgi:hypothetical protein